ncbi:MAG: hypothetical protein IJ653_02200 [Bacteroidales bacterium]|nr:hypothetical protein [Bacteroidales bacterium]
MKRLVLAALLILAPFLAQAQTISRIRSDPAYLWAEGWGARPSAADGMALEALAQKLAATDELPGDAAVRQALWRTYLPELEAVSEIIDGPSGSVFRYLAWKDIPKVFESRWRKVRELAASAEQAFRRGETAAARTYCRWAGIYLSSLPPGEYALRDRLTALQERLGPGEEARIRMRNVESETDGILAALGRASRPVAQPRPRAEEISVAQADTASSRPPVDSLPDPARTFPLRLEVPASGFALLPPEPGTAGPPTPESRWSWRVLAAFEAGRIPAYGLMAAGSSGDWGAFLSFRSNFRPFASDYDSTSDGRTDFGYLWAGGGVRSARLSLSAGALRRVAGTLQVYAGAGYGMSSVFWEDSDGGWARVTDLSRSGLLLDAGFCLDAGAFTFCAGACSLGLRVWSCLLGAGFRF